MSFVSPRDGQGRTRSLSVRRPSEKRNISRSATRALDVLELFGAMQRPLRACEIARALGMSPSTTNQLLKTMVDSAHLLFGARSRTYLPAPRLAGFGLWVSSLYGADKGLRALVNDLAARVGMTVTLSAANDLFMQILESAEPGGAVIERGQCISLFGSSIGSAYLATLDEREVERLAFRARVPEAELPMIHATLSVIRRDGFAHGLTSADGHCSVATVLPSATLPVSLVLGVARPGDGTQIDVTALCATIAEAVADWARLRSSFQRVEPSDTRH